MNREQARHAESIARHMLQHVEHFKRRLEVVQTVWQQQQYELYPLRNVQEVFVQDLEHMKQELDQVNRDMLAQLEDM